MIYFSWVLLMLHQRTKKTINNSNTSDWGALYFVIFRRRFTPFNEKPLCLIKKKKTCIGWNIGQQDVFQENVTFLTFWAFCLWTKRYFCLASHLRNESQLTPWHKITHDRWFCWTPKPHVWESKYVPFKLNLQFIFPITASELYLIIHKTILVELFTGGFQDNVFNTVGWSYWILNIRVLSFRLRCKSSISAKFREGRKNRSHERPVLKNDLLREKSSSQFWTRVKLFFLTL